MNTFIKTPRLLIKPHDKIDFEGSGRFWRAIIKHYSAQALIEYTRQIAHFRNKIYSIFKFKTGKNQ